MTSRSVPVKLDRLRHLKFSFNALADLQDIDPKIFTKNLGDLAVIRRYLWAGMKHEDNALTEQKVGEILEDYVEQDGDLIDLSSKIGDAIEGAVFSKRSKTEPSQKPNEGAPSKNSAKIGSKR